MPNSAVPTCRSKPSLFNSKMHIQFKCAYVRQQRYLHRITASISLSTLCDNLQSVFNTQYSATDAMMWVTWLKKSEKWRILESEDDVMVWPNSSSGAT
ncbi:hypothetical protein Hdeb2414_s0025g00655681 [Helianthus debilis subsp. tardiflorus]